MLQPMKITIYANSITKKANQTWLYNVDTRRFVFISRKGIFSVNIFHIMVIQMESVVISFTILMVTHNARHHTINYKVPEMKHW